MGTYMGKGMGLHVRKPCPSNAVLFEQRREEIANFHLKSKVALKRYILVQNLRPILVPACRFGSPRHKGAVWFSVCAQISCCAASCLVLLKSGHLTFLLLALLCTLWLGRHSL